MRRFPRCVPRHIAPSMAMRDKTKNDGRVHVRSRPKKKSDGWDEEPCPRCGSSFVSMLDMDFQDEVQRLKKPQRYHCNACKHRWG